ncbi:outer spore coat protein E [Desulfocucumis palustris]|uniref:Outer spore coat protein E n=1 Tax=Desulfocucumis palustris TaxID=1898651 RepID=A0A2L2XB96_9FIRM|nr:outer spore coat protein CotE [Desulfocucumis palustris]GBF33342.1 outer spore coat protein E [Desulfocucumis palustris]
MSDITGAEKRSLSFPKGAYREIITKAVCGTAKKYFRYSQHFVPTEGLNPNAVLGTSITQMRLKEPEVTEVGGSDKVGVRVNGIFEVHIWYAYNNGKSTELIRQAINFEEIIPMTEYDMQSSNLIEARAIVIRPPQCLDAATTDDGRIKVDFEVGIYAEVIGETKVKVKIAHHGEE